MFYGTGDKGRTMVAIRSSSVIDLEKLYNKTVILELYIGLKKTNNSAAEVEEDILNS